MEKIKNMNSQNINFDYGVQFQTQNNEFDADGYVAANNVNLIPILAGAAVLVGGSTGWVYRETVKGWFKNDKDAGSKDKDKAANILDHIKESKEETLKALKAFKPQKHEEEKVKSLIAHLEAEIKVIEDAVKDNKNGKSEAGDRSFAELLKNNQALNDKIKTFDNALNDPTLLATAQGQLIIAEKLAEMKVANMTEDEKKEYYANKNTKTLSTNAEFKLRAFFAKKVAGIKNADLKSLEDLITVYISGKTPIVNVVDYTTAAKDLSILIEAAFNVEKATTIEDYKKSLDQLINTVNHEAFEIHTTDHAKMNNATKTLAGRLTSINEWIQSHTKDLAVERLGDAMNIANPAALITANSEDTLILAQMKKLILEDTTKINNATWRVNINFEKKANTKITLIGIIGADDAFAFALAAKNASNTGTAEEKASGLNDLKMLQNIRNKINNNTYLDEALKFEENKYVELYKNIFASLITDIKNTINTLIIS